MKCPNPALSILHGSKPKWFFCGRKLEEEEEGLLCIVKVGSEYDEEEEGSLHFFFSSGRELVSQWENLPD